MIRGRSWSGFTKIVANGRMLARHLSISRTSRFFVPSAKRMLTRSPIASSHLITSRRHIWKQSDLRYLQLLIPSGPNAQLHLHVVITEQNADGEHLLVPVSSIKGSGHHDAACEMAEGDHEFIKKASFV